MGPSARTAGPARTARPRLVFQRVRVAYLKCDGLARANGRFPCPRDKNLENAVWAILSNLPDCPEAAHHPGEGDVRLEFQHGGTPVVRASSRHHGSEPLLDADQVVACAGAPLGALQTSLAADDLRVSFRFRLVRPSR